MIIQKFQSDRKKEDWIGLNKPDYLNLSEFSKAVNFILKSNWTLTPENLSLDSLLLPEDADEEDHELLKFDLEVLFAK